MGSNVRALGVVGLVQAVDLALECTVLSEGGGKVFGTQSLWAKVLGPGPARFVFSGFGFC